MHRYYQFSIVVLALSLTWIANESQAQFRVGISPRGAVKNIVTRAAPITSLSLRRTAASTQPTSHQQPSCQRPAPIDTYPVYRQTQPAMPLAYTNAGAIPPSSPAIQPAPAIKTAPVLSKTSADLASAKNAAKIARAFMRTNQHRESLQYANKALRYAPKDAYAFQMRGLAHFALGDDKAAAADIYDAFQNGNAWTRTGVMDFYTDHRRYGQQMTALIQRVHEKPTASGHFLLAYHRMVNGQYVSSAKQLRAFLALSPKEPVASALLAAVSKKVDANRLTSK